MKNILFQTIFVFCISSFFCAAINGQVLVRERPAHHVIAPRPKAPGSGYTWISGEYVWKAHKYEYVAGYWAVPPYRKTKWVEGRWRHRRGGWLWIPGRWK